MTFFRPWAYLLMYLLTSLPYTSRDRLVPYSPRRRDHQVVDTDRVNDPARVYPLKVRRWMSPTFLTSSRKSFSMMHSIPLSSRETPFVGSANTYARALAASISQIVPLRSLQSNSARKQQMPRCASDAKKASLNASGSFTSSATVVRDLPDRF